MVLLIWFLSKEYYKHARENDIGNNIIIEQDEYEKDKSIFLHHEGKKIKIHDLKPKYTVPENYIDHFTYKTKDNKQYIVLVVSWEAKDEEGFVDKDNTIYIYDLEGKNVNKDEKYVWFGKWFGENDDQTVMYEKKDRKYIIDEMKKLELENKI